MESTKEKASQSIEEISLKDILLKIHEYVRYFWSKKLFFVIPLILFVSYFVYKAKTAPFIFTAETKFFLEGGSKSNMGGLGGLLGQIGGKKTNPYQIIEVAESKIHLSEVLFEKIGPDSMFIANRILKTYDLPTVWSEESSEYADFKFEHDSIPAFTYLENKALSKLFRILIDNQRGSALLRTGIEDEKGYFFIKANTLDHDLSLRLSEISYENLKNYFEVKTREKLKITRDVLKVKSDSIKSLLDSKIAQLADYKDRNKSLISNREQVREVILESEVKGLNSAYIEVLQSYEMADYKYMDQSSYFMLIDKPMRPLGVFFANWKLEAIKGAILSFILVFGFLFVQKVYRDILNS